MNNDLKILIVDDEFLTAMAFADFLSDHGYSIVGPYSNQDDALVALTETSPDAAFLDINLGNGETSEKIATILRERSTPFVFLTGYSECTPFSADFDDAVFLAKPVNETEALEKLAEMVGSG